jgi:hypothetical protein
MRWQKRTFSAPPRQRLCAHPRFLPATEVCARDLRFRPTAKLRHDEMRAVAKSSAFAILPSKKLNPLVNRGVYGLDLS